MAHPVGVKEVSLTAYMADRYCRLIVVWLFHSILAPLNNMLSGCCKFVPFDSQHLRAFHIRHSVNHTQLQQLVNQLETDFIGHALLSAAPTAAVGAS